MTSLYSGNEKVEINAQKLIDKERYENKSSSHLTKGQLTTHALKMFIYSSLSIQLKWISGVFEDESSRRVTDSSPNRRRG